MGSLNRQVRDVSVQIFDDFEDAVCASWLESVCRVVLEQEGVHQHVSLVIADDGTVRELNAEYRGLDKPTDVLSFAFDNQGEYYGKGDVPSDWSVGENFVLPPGESAGLGEVIVSYPQAVRQAHEAGRSTRQEIALLIAHGILHLMGHDHIDDEDERVMRARERGVLDRLAEAKMDICD